MDGMNWPPRFTGRTDEAAERRDAIRVAVLMTLYGLVMIALTMCLVGGTVLPPQLG